MKSKLTLWVLIVIVVVGVGMRAWQLPARSLWFDEAFSWRLIQFPFTEMIDRAAADVHPPLYYVLLRGWAKVFGASTLALRSFSVAMAGATIVLAYGFTKYATNSHRAGLLAAALLAASGWQIAFAWEARMYTLGTALAIASAWLLLRGIRRPGPGIWLAYGVVAALFAYTHYFAFFTLAAHALFVIGVLLMQTRGRIGEVVQTPLLWFAGMGALLAVACYIPWIPTFVRQNTQVQAVYWVPPVTRWSIPDSFYRMAWPTAESLAHELPGVLVTFTPLILMIIVWGLLLVVRRNRDGNILTVLLGLVPFVLALVVSFVGRSLYQDRFLVFANIFMWIAVAALIEYLPGRWRTGFGVLVLLMSLTASGLYWRELAIPTKGGAQEATVFIQKQRQDGEPVLVSSPFVFFSIDHYLQESFGKPGEAKLYSETGELLHFAGGPILKTEDVAGPELFTQRDIRTIWLVDTTGFGGTKMAVPAPWRATTEQTFSEVFAHQGEVFVTKYSK